MSDVVLNGLRFFLLVTSARSGIIGEPFHVVPQQDLHHQRTCLRRFLAPSNERCAMVHAAQYRLPPQTVMALTYDKAKLLSHALAV